MTRSKIPRCRSAGSEKIRVITRPEMSSQEAREEWGPVLPRSTNHQVSNFVTLVYTKYIPGIYQVFTNVKVYTWYIPRIYKVYPWYIPCISPTLVYTWYIPGIYCLYVNVGDIAGICHAKTLMHLFGTSHEPPLMGHIPEIYQVYDQSRGVRDWYRTSASKFLCGIYLLCRRH